ncbi:unannotated protein [freshwater metagenome]|uniref:Unannotated protein n=1 Tax=freshwater metagenome TaxID=449393 RepID=A0A6J6HIG3_9ZZZZ
MAQGNRGVFAAAGQEQAQRAAHRDAATNHDNFSSVDRDVVAAHQFQDSTGGARQGCVDAKDQATQVHGVEAIGILVRINQFKNAIGIQAGGQWQLHDETRTSRIVIELANRCFNFVLAGSSG